MTKIFVPSRGASDWKGLLARPDTHWKAGYSAMCLAQCWEEASGALPPEVAQLLRTGSHAALEEPELIFAVPEFQVQLPGGSRATQTDIFALVRGTGGLAACAVEGKVDEEFGPTIARKRDEGAAERLAYLHDLLQVDPATSGPLRYQLFHRTAAAILLAKRFCAPVAVLVVHSFSPKHRWFADFEAFGKALGVPVGRNTLAAAGQRAGVDIYLGWATGSQRFRIDLSGAAV